MNTNQSDLNYQKLDVKHLVKMLHDARTAQFHMKYRFLANYKIKSEVERLNNQWNLKNPDGESKLSKNARNVLSKIISTKSINEDESLVILKSIFHIE